MGVNYIAVPLHDEFCEYLEEEEIEFPEIEDPSRDPCPNDLLEVFSKLTHLDVKSGFIAGHWQAGVINEKEDFYTVVRIDTQSMDSEGVLSFEKGHPELLIEILDLLAKSLGPFGLVPDTGETPVVATGSTNINEVLSLWGYDEDYEDEEV